MIQEIENKITFHLFEINGTSRSNINIDKKIIEKGKEYINIFKDVIIENVEVTYPPEHVEKAKKMFTINNSKFTRECYNAFLCDYLDNHKYIKTPYTVIYDNNIIEPDEILSQERINEGVQNFLKKYPDICIDNVQVKYGYGKYILNVYQISANKNETEYLYYFNAYKKYVYESITHYFYQIFVDAKLTNIEIKWIMSKPLFILEFCNILESYNRGVNHYIANKYNERYGDIFGFSYSNSFLNFNHPIGSTTQTPSHFQWFSNN